MVKVSGPSAVAAPSGYVGTFTIGDNAHLYERYYDQSTGWYWTDHGIPPGSTNILSPSAVAAPSGYVGVFAVDFNNAHLYERYYVAGSGWYWTDHGAPPVSGRTLLEPLGPSAVAAPSGYVGVFLAGTDGHLYERYYDQSTGWYWTDHGIPPGSEWASPPSTVAAPSGYVGAFTIGYDGQHLRLYERYYDQSTGWYWTDHGPIPVVTAAGISVSNLTAVAAPSGYVGVFVTSSDGHLHERYYVAGSGWFWADHGTPPGTPGVTLYTRSAVAAPSGYVGVFCIYDGKLYERYYVAGSGWFWSEHGTLDGTSATRAAYQSAVAAPSGYVGVFSTSFDNSSAYGHLYERYYDQSTGWYWTDHGTPA